MVYRSSIYSLIRDRGADSSVSKRTILKRKGIVVARRKGRIRLICKTDPSKNTCQK